MECPAELKDMPLQVLSQTSKRLLSGQLNLYCTNDYAALAELYGKSYDCIMAFGQSSDPTLRLLESLRGADNSISVLWAQLVQLGRIDVLKDCELSLTEHMKHERMRSGIQAFFSSPSVPLCSPGTGSVPAVQQMNRTYQRPVEFDSGKEPKANKIDKLLSIDDDVVNGENVIQHYAAYINCADSDVRKATDIMEAMAEVDYTMKLFLPQKHLSVGGCMLEDMAQVIQERCCGKVIVLLTNNYVKSEQCQFVANFAKALDPAARRSQVIPVYFERISPAMLPKMFIGLSALSTENFRNANRFYAKLKFSILA